MAEPPATDQPVHEDPPTETAASVTSTSDESAIASAEKPKKKRTRNRNKNKSKEPKAEGEEEEKDAQYDPEPLSQEIIDAIVKQVPLWLRILSLAANGGQMTASLQAGPLTITQACNCG